MSQNHFCRDLRAFAWKKIKAKIVQVEKNDKYEVCFSILCFFPSVFGLYISKSGFFIFSFGQGDTEEAMGCATGAADNWETKRLELLFHIMASSTFLFLPIFPSSPATQEVNERYT